MFVQTLSLGPLGTNCYIVSHNGECLIFDPSGEPEKVMDYIETEQLSPKAILLTHAHFDHIGALDTLRKQYKLDVYMHENERHWLENPELNRSVVYFGEPGAIRTQGPEKLVSEGTLTIGSFKMKVMHTPGHSPGSITFIFQDDAFIISGDVLFHHGIGRTDLPDGSLEQLIQSITLKLYTLPKHFKVYAGHNVQTTIEHEQDNNPYTLQFYKP